MIYLRSSLYLLGVAMFTPLCFGFVVFSLPLQPPVRYGIITLWSRIMLAWLRLTCGLKYRVIGTENIPWAPTVVLAKHQSIWETLFFQTLFPHQVWVVKRELLRIPFFGWGLALSRPIAIDRAAGREALKHVLCQGKERLDEGVWVVIFPEGTRVRPGEKAKYNIGGAWLASHAGVQALPVAHNAGEFWGRNAFLKHPGTITVSIGRPIDGKGKSPGEVNAMVEAWIEAEMGRISRRDSGAGGCRPVGAG